MIFERIPRFLSSLLFLCRCNFWIFPEKGIGPAVDSRAYRWKAFGTDPRLRVLIWRPIWGWLIVRVRIAHEFSEAPLLRLYFDSGKGFNAGETLRLIAVEDREFQGITFLQSPVIRVRFDPSENEGEFTIEQLAIYNVPGIFVRRLGIEALSAYHSDFRGDSSSDIRNRLLAQSRSTKKQFDETLEEKIRSLIERDDRVDYETWIREFELPFNLEQMRRWQNDGSQFEYKPLISVLLPIFDAPEAFLRECLDSVRNQIYPNWELCIADDASSMGYIRKILEEYEQKDKRVRVSYRTENGGVAAATNTALDMATGDYVALLDQDDTLAQNALLSIMEALQLKHRPRILYSDEDKLDINGLRSDPHFKSDWNPDLLYSQNYVSHLSVYEIELTRSIGGLREGVDGSQDYDLLLRASEYVDESQIHHIPLVLYHWRSSETSTAARAEAKLYAWDAGVRALECFFQARGNGVRVERGPVPFTYRARWPVPEPRPLVSIIIPTRDNLRLLATCISTLLKKTQYPSFEVLLVDNDSRDKQTLNYLSQIAEDGTVRLLRYPGAFNFSAMNNYASNEARGEFLCLLNDDIEVIDPGWLTEMVSHACRPLIGCVGAKLIYPDSRIQHGGIICGIRRVAGHSHKYFQKHEGGYFSRLILTQNLSAVTAACLLVRKSVWHAAGGMNSKHLPIAFNDVDFCLRVRKLGLRNIWTPYAMLIHHESASRGPEIGKRKEQRFANESKYLQTTWADSLNRDPYYNPHLTLEYEDFSIRSA